jgi:hypothetical protein
MIISEYVTEPILLLYRSTLVEFQSKDNENMYHQEMAQRHLAGKYLEG